jgi:hypothetical protein
MGQGLAHFYIAKAGFGPARRDPDRHERTALRRLGRCVDGLPIIVAWVHDMV